VNAGDTYNGKYVKLAADIDLKDEAWTPIAKFEGVFDGDNKTISNLVVNGGRNKDQGFFAVTMGGEIKNITFNNAKVTGRLDVGVVSGTPYTSKYTNIKVTGHVEVNGMAYVGGVGGKNAYADWTDITVDVDESSYVKAISTENGSAYRTYVGGVIGFMGEGSHTVKNVTSNINVIGDVCDIGGIVGIAHYGNNFENVKCTANVTNTNTDSAKSAQTGGIAGVWHNEKGYTVTFTNCNFTGKVTATGVAENEAVGAAYNASNNTEENSGSLVIDGETVWPIPELPTATVTEFEKEDLTFALNFRADDASEAQLAYYGDWYADYVLTVNKDVTFNANGGADGYLSGQYEDWSENWVNVPFEDVTLKAGESIKIMEYAATLMGQPGLKYTYGEVYEIVKDFNCGVFFDEEFLTANPDLEVTLELRMYNPDESKNESYVIGETYTFKAPVVETEYFNSGVYVLRTFTPMEIPETETIKALGTNKAYRVRVYAAVEDETKYNELGFTYKIKDADDSKAQSSKIKKLYEKVTITTKNNGVTPYVPTDFRADGKYIFALNIWMHPDFGSDTVIEVKPYGIKKDGTKIYGSKWISTGAIGGTDVK
ncbi:MAG: hypothetical protein IJZ12_03175, partial [Clostridia bacterium]|nr:hypothetical protein [Clostridia bacterium]